MWKSIEKKSEYSFTVDEVENFLDELVEARLAFKENDAYLSLAIPSNRQNQ